jgi:UDP-glucose 4-epimerase
MRYLVTGGAGYIGSTVATLLVEEGHEVTVLDDLSSGHESAVPQGARFIQGRVQDKVDDVLATQQYDGVLHLAAFIQVAESVAQPETYWHNNMMATVGLLDAMSRNGVSRFAFSSTSTVYGNSTQTPITESASIAPLNPYASTKAAVDMVLAGYAPTKGLAATSLRYFNAAGALLRPGGGSCGEQHVPESHLVPIVLRSPQASANTCRFTETITTHRTAPACGTMSTSPIWPRRTCWRCPERVRVSIASSTSATEPDTQTSKWPKPCGT